MFTNKTHFFFHIALDLNAYRVVEEVHTSTDRHFSICKSTNTRMFAPQIASAFCNKTVNGLRVNHTFLTQEKRMNYTKYSYMYFLHITLFLAGKALLKYKEKYSAHEMARQPI